MLWVTKATQRGSELGWGCLCKLFYHLLPTKFFGFWLLGMFFWDVGMITAFFLCLGLIIVDLVQPSSLGLWLGMLAMCFFFTSVKKKQVIREQEWRLSPHLPRFPVPLIRRKESCTSKPKRRRDREMGVPSSFFLQSGFVSGKTSPTRRLTVLLGPSTIQTSYRTKVTRLCHTLTFNC